MTHHGWQPFLFFFSTRTRLLSSTTTGMMAAVISTDPATTATTTPSSSSSPPLPPPPVIDVDDGGDTAVIDVDDDDNDDDGIDAEQLAEFEEQLIALGSHADKVTINTLSMIADDYKDSLASANKLYQILRQRLLRPNSGIASSNNTTGGAELLLPVLYVLDSVLKNCRGCYVRIVQNDAATWMPAVYRRLDAAGRGKLQKVWRTWHEFRLFDDDGANNGAAQWREMGRCFTDGGGGGGSHNDKAAASATAAASASSGPAPQMPAVVAGIARTRDGSLILSPALRREMQDILDDMQSDIANELEKVSLERLADINPDLLLNIKRAAEDAVGMNTNNNNNNNNSNNNNGGNSKHNNSGTNQQSRNGGGGHQQQQQQHQQLPAFLVETQSDVALARSNEWSDFMDKQQQPDIEQQASGIVATLHRLVADGTVEAGAATGAASVVYTRRDALRVTHYLATAWAVSHGLSTALESMRASRSVAAAAAAAAAQRRAAGQQSHTFGRTTAAGWVVDPAQFTNDGVKQHNAAAVSLLYEIGLPFQSAADGRRFRTQRQLSNHLDYLFQRNQLEKTMAVTDERGWYVVDALWTREQSFGDAALLPDAPQKEKAAADANGDGDPADGGSGSATTVPADETRDRCVLCGLPFLMFFDTDGDGVYKYRNCREITVMNDDAAAHESDQQLVHATCWKGLGQPDVLTYDQTLQETLRHT